MGHLVESISSDDFEIVAALDYGVYSEALSVDWIAKEPRQLRANTLGQPEKRRHQNGSLGLPQVAKSAVARALHDGLGARQLHVRTKAFGERQVHAAHQQESKLWLAQLFVELGVATARDIDLIGILRLRANIVVDGVTFREGGKCRRHVVSHVLGVSCRPPLLAETTVDIAQRLDERNQDLRLYFRLFYDGNAHASLR